jgi:hypothetical protein
VVVGLIGACGCVVSVLCSGSVVVVGLGGGIINCILSLLEGPCRRLFAWLSPVKDSQYFYGLLDVVSAFYRISS